MSAPLGAYGRACPHCGLLCPPGLQAHIECALEATRKGVAEEAVRRGAKEQRDERAKLDAAALVARKLERERIVAKLRTLAREWRAEAASCTQAATLQACAQRAAAVDEAATLIEEER